VDDDVEYTHLLDDPFHVALPRDHALAGRRRLKFADLAAEPWIQGTQVCACTRQLEVACENAGYQPRVAYESDDFQVVQGLVAAGVGIALIPGLALVSERPDIVIRAVGAKPPFRRIMAATLANGYRSPAVVEMLGTLKEIAADYAAGAGAALEAVS
jgi:DNA-binding transcriptional LysR family regulator